ncbi:TetR/AcrR family transcriptional regulator [Paenibacillus thalictri]|uniref:TetR/AcrR family transcriptional regulator n=1 Tax=Paenibacillus thalictri TaxID=2527873 RepID=A0A4Q9DPH5_9BACL|nr:TetR/AcrR family transcriptional regulator [Paenibacillus thalictri]TBL76041.1 TetR/AcrR family transcriptional regulator [Paenibacillus thalictri]
MPRNKEQNEEIRRERKEAIIRSALKVYVAKGYAAAEIGDVAEQAGVARGLVYYYFKDKMSLFRELFVFMFDQSKKHIESHFSSGAPVREQLEGLVRTMHANMLKESDSVLFFMRMRHDLNELFTTDELNKWSWRHDNMSLIRSVIKQGMERGELRAMSHELLASLYWGAVMSGMMHMRHVAQELREQGRSGEEIAELTRCELEDAVVCCMAILNPPMKEQGKDVDEA